MGKISDYTWSYVWNCRSGTTTRAGLRSWPTWVPWITWSCAVTLTLPWTPLALESPPSITLWNWPKLSWMSNYCEWNKETYHKWNICIAMSEFFFWKLWIVGDLHSQYLLLIDMFKRSEEYTYKCFFSDTKVLLMWWLRSVSYSPCPSSQPASPWSWSKRGPPTPSTCSLLVESTPSCTGWPTSSGTW